MKMFRQIFSWGVLGFAVFFAVTATAQEPARLTIQSIPAGAAVFLDGKELAIKTPVRLNIPPGSHQIGIRKIGYQPVSRAIEVSGISFVNFTLTPVRPVPKIVAPAATPAPASPRPAPMRPSPAPTNPVTNHAAGNAAPPAPGAPSSVKPLPQQKPPSPDTHPAAGSAHPLAPAKVVKPSLPLAVTLESGDSATAPAAGSTTAGITPCRDRGAAGVACVAAPDPAWPDSAETRMFRAVAKLPRFPEKFNVLLLGLDRRDRQGLLATGAEIPEERLKRINARSDVMMVIQLDFAAHQIRMVSIPRDTRVRLPGHGGTDKINAAYALGRERLAKRTVESFFGIPIHRVIVADWRGAKKCISLFKTLGLDYNGFSERELFWHLRKRTFQRGDFHRIERQQQFLRYALGEYLRLYNDTLGRGTAVMVKRGVLEMAVNQGLKVIETDLTWPELKILSYLFRDYDIQKTTLAQVRGAGGLTGGDADGDTGVYFFNPSPNHSFNEIVARAEKTTQVTSP